VAGFGDTMIFARYVPILASMGAKVICKPQAPLTKLFKQSKWGVEVIDDLPEDNVKFDFQSSFMVLPALFKSKLENIPLKEGYLKADPEKIAYFKQKYFNNDKLKVGIVWQCGNAEAFDNNRSVSDLNLFSEILQIPDIKFYSLQKEVNNIDGYDNSSCYLQNFIRHPELVSGSQDPAIPKQVRNDGTTIELDSNLNYYITALGPEFNDFADTAAAIENCDLVITVDTATAHLAGALGKTTWTLIPYSPHWVWLLEGEGTMWYTNMRLFRQKEPDNWKAPIKEIYETLKTL
jgi:hypothetical protein